MKGYFQRAAAALQKFMIGRYGPDELVAALFVFSCILTFLSNFRPLRYLYFIAIAVLAIAVWRMLSKNIAKRSDERYKFLRLTEKPMAEFRLLKNKIRDRKTHKYFKCKNCGASLRIPKGKGKISVTCPKCRVKVTKNS